MTDPRQSGETLREAEGDRSRYLAKGLFGDGAIGSADMIVVLIKSGLVGYLLFLCVLVSLRSAA